MFLNLLYGFLKIIFRILLRVFYPYTTVINKQGFKFDNPTIVVSNHPNTLLDPIGVAVLTRKQLFFLANASLFSNPVANWLLNKLYCIPIMRKQDIEKNQVDNDESFKRSYEHFEKGGSLFIAPEGSSFMERRLRPVKSGTARIALGAEAANDWKLGLTILPVGLTYSDPNKFGSRLVINAGTPIKVSDFKEDYEKDAVKTWTHLTKLLEKRMQTLITHSLDDEEDDFIQKLEAINLSEEKDMEKVFRNTQNRIALLRGLEAQEYQNLKDKTDNYFQLLNSNKTNDRTVFLKKQGVFAANLQVRGLLLILGFAFFVYGAINHLFAFGIPTLLAKKANLYIGYDSTVKILAGLITFPLFYILQYKLINSFLDPTVAIIYILTLPAIGLFSWKYAGYYKLSKAIYHFSRLSKRTKTRILKGRKVLKAVI